MPLQNRVTPRSEIIVSPSRGLYMGNRGRLHDDERRLVVHPNTRRRDWTLRRWIICRLDFGSRRRLLMSPDEYTELFFLDEATALAAGHRPCLECRREDGHAFAASWKIGNPALAEQAASTPARDRRLHADRRMPDGSQRTHQAVAADLPDGTMIEVDADAHVVVSRSCRRWSPDGYGPARPLPSDEVVVLTPSTTVAALRAGYRPVVHPSALVPPGSCR